MDKELRTKLAAIITESEPLNDSIDKVVALFEQAGYRRRPTGEPELLTNRQIREAKAQQASRMIGKTSYKRFAATRYDAAIAQAQRDADRKFYDEYYRA